MKLNAWIFIFVASIIAKCYCKLDGQILPKDKETFFAELLNRVEEPLSIEKWINLGVKLLDDKTLYVEWTVHMEEFYQAAQKGKLLGKHEFFGALITTHHRQMLGLYEFLKNPHEWEHFVQNACWARQHVNAHMFVYALKMAALARYQYNGLFMPAIYEIMTREFYDENFIKVAKEFEIEAAHSFDKETITTVSNETNYETWQWWKRVGIDAESWYGVGDDTAKAKYFWRVVDSHHHHDRHHHQQHQKDSVLSYLIHDNNWLGFWFDINQLYAYPVESAHNRFPLWRESLAEFWFHILQQYLTRYRLERLSHGLGPIPDLDWDAAKIHFGYAVNSMREIYDNLAYIHHAIAEGKLLLSNGTELNLRKPTSARYIYDALLRGHQNAAGQFFHTNWYSLALMNFANVTRGKPGLLHTKVQPHKLLNFETMPQEPYFYVFHQEILKLKQHFESHLPPYEQHELHVNGIEILSLQLSAELTTYDSFGYYVVTNLLPATVAAKAKFRAVLLQLNHMPVNFSLEIQSDSIREIILRVYLAPKLDEFGRVLSLPENRQNFLHLTTETGTLKVGENVMNFSLINMQKNLNAALFPFNTCSLAENLLLPRGRIEGMPMQLFVHVLDKDAQNDVVWWHACTPAGFYGAQTLGFPFDRPIQQEQDFLGANMFFKDILIRHININKSSLNV